MKKLLVSISSVITVPAVRDRRSLPCSKASGKWARGAFRGGQCQGPSWQGNPEFELPAFLQVAGKKTGTDGAIGIRHRVQLPGLTPMGLIAPDGGQCLAYGLIAERLAQVVVHAGGQACLAVALHGVGGQGDDRDRRVAHAA
jgi:hypothetical protein